MAAQEGGQHQREGSGRRWQVRMVAASEGWQHQKDGKVEGTRMVAASEEW